MKVIFNKFPFLIFIFLYSLKTFSQSEFKSFEQGIDAIINDPFFEKSTIALDIFDLTDSTSLFQKNEKLLLRPASNMKILTSIAGIVNLGLNYKFNTELYHSGVIEGETLYGDLYVVGGFDPDLTTEDLDSLVRVVQSLGIKEIKGGIFADISKKDSLYWGKGWMWDDDPGPSAPFLSALNINDNSVEVFVEGDEIGSSAKISLTPKTNYAGILNNTVTVPNNYPENFKITRDWINRKNTIIVDGEVRKATAIDSAANTEKLSILYPEKYFLTLFKEHLEENGILIYKEIEVGKLKENSVYLASIKRDIDTVLSDINKESDNLNAEMIIYAMALKDSGAPAIANNGLESIKKIIDSLGFNSNDYSIADGSGASHYNLLSAEVLLGALKLIYYKRNDLFEIFYSSFAIAGVDGTLKKRMKNSTAEGNVHAKTGTLRGVSNLTGYVTSKKGHLIAFSILIQNFVEDYSIARKFQDIICVLLVDYE